LGKEITVLSGGKVGEECVRKTEFLFNVKCVCAKAFMESYFEGGGRGRRDPEVELGGQFIFTHILKNSVSVYRTSELFKESLGTLLESFEERFLVKVQVKHLVSCCLSHRNQHLGRSSSGRA
jgi:hypothetical protein